MEKLNDDIFLLIGDHLEEHNDRYNAIFVNRRFFELFSRALYRSASLEKRLQVQPFLKAITLRPNLASVVRSLDCAGWESSSQQPRLSKEETALFSLSAKTNSHSLEEHSLWERDLRDGIDEAWIALLLSSVHNIRQLKLAIRTAWNPGATWTACAQELRRNRNHLADARLFINCMRCLCGNGLEMMRTRARCLCRKSCHLCACLHRPEPAYEQTNKEDAHEPSAERTKSKSLSEITLTSSNAYRGLESILSSCASLKSFKYQHTDALLLAEGFRPSAFKTSLAPHKSTHETIWLDNFGTHLPFTINGVNESHEEWFGSFADFTALKKSAHPSLYIEDCKERSLGMLLAQVGLVLEVRTRKRFKELKRLDIEGSFHDDEEDADMSGGGNGERVIKPRVYDMVEPLRGVCEEAEVQLYLRDRTCLHTMQ
ncbi:hypothetical protein BDW66DRAFT_163971 [Aspergillus desertorum]